MAFCTARVAPSFARAAARPQGARLVVARAQDAVATPYANGILELACERDILDDVHKDLMSLQAMMTSGEGSENRDDLRSFLLGVPLEAEERKNIISALAKEVSMKQETLDFLHLLIDVNRMDAIEDIIAAFDLKYNVITDTQNVTLKSAARLAQDQEFEIAKMLQEVTKSKNIKIKPVVDEELIGGFVVQWDDNQVDLSIKGHLDRIEGELMSAAGAV
eukprot:jgi/Ulvmu1/646/UM010_0016.1